MRIWVLLITVIISVIARFRVRLFKKEWLVLWLASSMILIIIYTLARVSLLPERKVLLIPLRTYVIITESKWRQHGYYVAREVIGNIMLFIPFGISKSSCGKATSIKSVSRKTIIEGLCLAIFIELLQFFTRLGTFEIDDVINNCLGTMIGCCIMESAIARFDSSETNISFIKLFPVFVVLIILCIICGMGILNN